MRRSFTLALAALAAAGLTACSQANGQDEAFGQKVRAYLLEHPEVLEEAIRALDAKRSAEAAADQTKALAANRKALEADPRDPVVGKGPITVVEFFDYRCGYCKSSAPEVLKLVASNKDVRFVFKEFPILPDANGRIGVSERAARIALAAKDSGKYVDLHRDLMAQKALDDAAVTRVAQKHGLDAATLLRAGQAPAVDEHLADTHELAQKLNIAGTPAFVIGNTVIPGADLEALRAAISDARKKKRA